jgi:hypothetical protein
MAIRLGVLLGFCAVARLSGAQDALERPSFSIVLTGPQLEVKVGKPVAVRVTITNTSNQYLPNAVIPNTATQSKTRRSIELRVYDGNGKAIAESTRGRRSRGQEPDQSVGVLTVLSFPIAPGQAIQETADLFEEFDVKTPGQYVVVAERFDPRTKQVIKSNTISVRVVP